ncbi:acyltransferase family protein [soil metagenome]
MSDTTTHGLAGNSSGRAFTSGGELLSGPQASRQDHIYRTVEQFPATRRSVYRPEIDGLRALAVIPVVLFHAGIFFKGGYVGVDVFFVISGFLITRLMEDEISRGTFSLISFWERRVRRILPALVTVILATFIAGWVLLLPDHFMSLARSALAQIGLVSNVFFRKQSRYFSPASETMPLLHTWSLSVEEQFYVAFPVILFLASKRSRGFMLATVAALFCVSFGISVYSSYHNSAKAFFLLHNRAWELALGALLVLMPMRSSPPKWVRELASWAGIAAILAAAALYDSQTRFPGIPALLPCLGAFTVIWANSSQTTSAGRLLAMKPLVFVGLISYSLYLWHWPAIVFAKYSSWNDWTWSQSSALEKVLFLGCVGVISTASWRWIEAPFRRRGSGFTRRQIFVWGVAACALLAGMAALIRTGNGYPARFPAEALRYAAMKKDSAFRRNVKAADAIAGNFPFIGAASAEARLALLVWGDSHAMAIMPAIDAVLKERGLRGVQATHASTAPVYGFEPGRGLREEAVDFGEAILDFVAKNNVRDVILAARWDGYPADEKFRQKLCDTVTLLRAGGAQVWVMKQVPRQRRDIPRAAAKEVVAGRDPHRVGIPVKEYLAVQAKTEELFQAAATAGAKILDPADYLVSPDGIFLAVSEGRALYVDAHHLSTAGALRVKPLFEKVVPPE